MSDVLSTDVLFSGNAMARKEKPDWLADKFWDFESGEVRVEALAKSYAELEKMMGATPNAPAGIAPDASINLPNSPEGYTLDVDDLLEVDADVNKRLYDAGFSNDQAQLVYDLAAERLLPMVQQITGEVDDARQLERVVQHFGGAQKFEAMRPQLRAWAQANLKPEVFQALAGSAEGVIAIHAMMQNREPGLGGGTVSLGGAGEADLKRMMADPRYWRDREPSFVAQVREGFRQLYPET
jgi:hypothetical protein